MSVRAVTLDALGTLVTFRSPAPLLVGELARRGATVTEEQAARALATEIAFYRKHHDEASDRSALAVLRERCAGVLAQALPPAVRELPRSEVLAALLGALRFEPFPEAPAALRALRARGVRLVVASNWDVSLRDVLAETGLDRLLDGVVISAEERVAKPDPELLRRALRLAGVAPEEALHVGDEADTDVAAARAAGVRAVLVDRSAAPGAVAGATVIGSLAPLAELVDGDS